jgi:hypothetical protein
MNFCFTSVYCSWRLLFIAPFFKGLGGEGGDEMEILMSVLALRECKITCYTFNPNFLS